MVPQLLTHRCQHIGAVLEGYFNNGHALSPVHRATPVVSLVSTALLATSNQHTHRCQKDDQCHRSCVTGRLPYLQSGYTIGSLGV